MDHFIGLDDDAPPAKRLKLQLADADNRDLNNNIEFSLPCPKSDVRKRKIAVKPQKSKTILDLNPYDILEIFEHLPLNDLCNVAQSNNHLADLARIIFQKRYRNGFRMHTNGKDNIELLIRVLTTFSDAITAVELQINHDH